MLQEGEGGERLRRRLEARGATVAWVPVLEFVPATGEEQRARLADALDGCETYDWVLFTSARSVSMFLEPLRNRRGSVAALGRVSIGSVGPATSRALAAFGLDTNLVPASSFSAQGLLEELAGSEAVRGRRFLIPRAVAGRDVLPEGLIRHGAAHVETVAIYESRTNRSSANALVVEWRRGCDYVTLSSPSTASSFVDMLGAERHPVERLSEGPLRNPPTRYACIGPVTAESALALGMAPVLMAREATLESLVSCIVEDVAKHRRRPS